MATIDDILGSPDNTEDNKPNTDSPTSTGTSSQGRSDTKDSRAVSDSPMQSEEAGIELDSAILEARPELVSSDKGNNTDGDVEAPQTDARPMIAKPEPGEHGALMRDPRDKRMSYLDLYKAMNPNIPETAEQKARREKNEKREAFFAALGDGISAFSNLYFTTQYAPDSYDPQNGMSGKTKERWDKLRAIREAHNKEYMDGYLRSMSFDDARDREDRNWKHTLDRERILDDRADKKEEREKKKTEQNELMFQAKYALQLGKLTEQGYRNVIAEIKAGKIEELTDAQIRRLNRSGGGHSGGSGQKWAYYDEDGKVSGYVQTRDEAIRMTENNQGTYPSLNTETHKTTTDKRGKTKNTTTTVSRKTAGTKSGKREYTNTSNIKWEA